MNFIVSLNHEKKFLATVSRVHPEVHRPIASAAGDTLEGAFIQHAPDEAGSGGASGQPLSGAAGLSGRGSAPADSVRAVPFSGALLVIAGPEEGALNQ